LPFENSFSLIDHNGNEFNKKSFSKNPSLVFFGFTHCPEVCPTTLYDIARWKELVGENAINLQTYFVTLDPNRDNQKILKDYVSNFRNIKGVTGSDIDIINFSKSWGIYRKIIPTEENNYSLDHTATIFLVDKKLNLRGTISFGENEENAVDKINNLLEFN
tara:strand:+ start:3885 stop:4367 length:483 start_codon:yes stop_codon:yes gene_type:complete